MPKIEITEQDLTSPGGAAQITDVVYVPGFVDTTQFADPTQALEVNKPTLFTSITQFETKCGEHPLQFAEDQTYSSLTKPAQVSGFDTVSIPVGGIMFKQGDSDPGYIMAKELIASGLPVLFERVNKGSETVTSYQPLSTQPSDWGTNSNYFVNTTSYDSIVSESMPVPMVVQNGIAVDTSKTYLTYSNTELDGTVTFEEVSGSTIPAEYLDNGKIKPADSTVPYYYLNEGQTVDYYAFIESDQGTYEKDSELGYALINNELTRTATDAEVGAHKLIVLKDALSGLKNIVGVKIGTTVYKINSAAEADKKVTVTSDSGPFTITFAEGDTKFISGAVVTITTDRDVTKYAQTKVSVTNNKIVPANWSTIWNTDAGTSENKEHKIQATSGTAFVSGSSFEKITTVLNGLNIKTFYSSLTKIFSADEGGLADQGNYSFKYLTTGGYPVYEYEKGALVTKMLSLAQRRGDCVAIIDHTDKPEREENIDLPGSLYKAVLEDESLAGDSATFGTMFTPWAKYNRITSDKVDGEVVSEAIRMPASFAYLTSLADSIKTNANWLAVAGATRGAVINLATDGMTTNIPNGAADRMQARNDRAVNPITNINPYGNIIWGNRTLKDNKVKGNLTATSFLNIRNMVSDVKKQCYKTAKLLTFEQNNDLLFLNFKSKITPLLDQMVTGYGIKGYKVVKDLDKLQQLGNPKATLCIKILLVPVYPVEDFFIAVILSDSEDGATVTVAE